MINCCPVMDGFEESVFDEMRNYLNGMNQGSNIGSLDISIVSRNDSIDVEKVMEDCQKYLELAKRFYNAACFHDEEEAYKLGEVAFDDFQQKLAVLEFVYPEQAEELDKRYEKLETAKNLVEDSFKHRVERLTNREYRQVSISIDEYERQD